MTTTLNANALVSLDEVRQAFGLDVLETKDDDFITSLINRYSTRIESYCNKTLHAGLLTEYHDGDGETGLAFVDNPPIISVSGIWDDVAGYGAQDSTNYGSDTEVTSDEYVVEATEGTIRLVNQSNILASPSNVFQRGVQNIKIIYSGGYLSIPEDIKEACIDWVAGTYRKYKDKLMGLSSKSSAGGSIVPDSMSMPNSVKATLAPYRRIPL